MVVTHRMGVGQPTCSQCTEPLSHLCSTNQVRFLEKEHIYSQHKQSDRTVFVSDLHFITQRKVQMREEKHLNLLGGHKNQGWVQSLVHIIVIVTFRNNNNSRSWRSLQGYIYETEMRAKMTYSENTGLRDCALMLPNCDSNFQPFSLKTN